MQLNVKMLESFARQSGVKNILQTKPAHFCKVNSSEFNKLSLCRLNQDVFQKIVNPVSAKDKHIKEFSDLLTIVCTNSEKNNQNELDKLGNLLSEVIKSNMNPENYIGAGKTGKIYRIDNKYVFKKFKFEFEEKKANNFELDTNSVNEKIPNWCGGPVASSNNILILKNADPKGIAVPVGVPFEIVNDAQAEHYYKNIYLQKCANMPQHAFDNLANDFKTLNSSFKRDTYYRYFDTYNPNNFLLVGDEIKIVDDICETEFDNPNNLTSMLKVFLLRYSVDIEASFEKALVPQRRKILEKCIIANEKAELPIDYFYHENCILEESLNLVDIKSTHESLLAKIREFRNNIPDKNQRIDAVKEYLNTLE